MLSQSLLKEIRKVIPYFLACTSKLHKQPNNSRLRISYSTIINNVKKLVPQDNSRPLYTKLYTMSTAFFTFFNVPTKSQKS